MLERKYLLLNLSVAHVRVNCASLKQAALEVSTDSAVAMPKIWTSPMCSRLLAPSISQQATAYVSHSADSAVEKMSHHFSMPIGQCLMFSPTFSKL